MTIQGSSVELVHGAMQRFCDAAPAPAVVRVRVSVGDKVGGASVDVEQRYGAAVPTSQLQPRFANLTEGETLLVSVGKDGEVLGTAWPVFRNVVSLENGIPDMSEAEAASLLLSPSCREGLRTLRSNGLHPAPASTGGCAHCHTSPAAPLDAGGATILLTAALVTATILRRRS
jgi:hypothetical protein